MHAAIAETAIALSLTRLSDHIPPPLRTHCSKPMNGQLSCEGPQGKTSLKSVQEGPVKTRDLEAKKKVDPASVKKHMMY